MKSLGVVVVVVVVEGRDAEGIDGVVRGGVGIQYRNIVFTPHS